MFAAPFIAQLGKGHVDGVYSIGKDPLSLQRFASGSGDGVIKVWDLSSREEVWHTQAHDGMVKGICWTKDQKLLSCASDKTIKMFDPYNTGPDSAPLATYLGQTAFTGVSHHRSLPNFAASSSVISVFDLSRATSTPLQTLQWPTQSDTISALAFNQSETSIIASIATDRSIILWDLRTSSPLSKMTLALACKYIEHSNLNFHGTNKISANSITWNPMEPFNFVVGNEDHV